MRWLALVLLIAVTRIASGHPESPPQDYIAEDPPPLTEWREHPATLEWSTWLGFGVGVASSPPMVLARGALTDPDRHTAVVFSAGAEATLSLSHTVRLGAWAGLHDFEPMAGGELQLTARPKSLDLFFYEGEGVWTLRVGGGPDHMTAAIAWGYRCPWKLWGPYSTATRYEIGPRITLMATRAYADPNDWTATLGLEVEPVGALRYLLGIRSWY